ncbi:MAG: hypothetical protein FWE01_00315 [Firmicutes bacterium]|nr:hypothetical protein [Bacillota bacterium]
MIYTNEILDKDLATNNLSQSYLLVSFDILYLEEIAKRFSKNFNIADVFWLRPKDGGKSISVEQVIAFNENVHLAAIGFKKLLVISDFSAMTIQAQNKMLKVLEDIRNDSVFLLLASNPDRVINTIKSRCVILYQQELKGASLYEQDLFTNNKATAEIFESAKALFVSKDLNEALPHIVVLGNKDNFKIALIALSKQVSLMDLKAPKTYRLMSALSEINRNVEANCNPTNALDLLVIELFQC